MGEPGLFPELATAAARWRSQSTTRVAWREKGGSSAVGVGPGGCGGAACGGRQQEVACGPPLAAGGAALRRRQRKQRGERRKTQAGPVCNFRKV